MEAASGIAMLTARLGRDTDFVARLAAPLWARVGRTIRVEDLSWTRNLAGEEGPGIVWRALEEVGGLLSGQSRLTAEGVAQLCSALVSTRVSPSASSDPYRGLPQVVWTLPLAHIRHTSRSASYREAFVDLIDRSQKRMILVAPFVDSAGISGLMTALLTAMLRRVVVILLTILRRGLNETFPLSGDSGIRESNSARRSYFWFATQGGGRWLGVESILRKTSDESSMRNARAIPIYWFGTRC